MDSERHVDSPDTLASKEAKIEALRTMVASAGWIKVLKPALVDVIASTQAQWMGNFRAKGEENLTDEALKCRAAALSWVLAWERKYVQLVDQLEELRALQEKTEPPAEGGSPY